MTRPKLRLDDHRCWCGCGRFAPVIDVAWLTDDERGKLKAKPRGCRAHSDFVEARLVEEIAKFRTRNAAPS